MLEDAVGHLIGGALWGAGAGLLLTFTRGGGEGVGGVGQGLMKLYVSVSDRVQEAASEVRENVEDLAAEIRSENDARTAQDER